MKSRTGPRREPEAVFHRAEAEEGFVTERLQPHSLT